jgi:hypothetical protein
MWKSNRLLCCIVTHLTQSALAALTLIILFVEMLKFSTKQKKFKEQNFVKGNRGYFEMLKNILFFNMKPSKLVNYLTEVLNLPLYYSIYH